MFKKLASLLFALLLTCSAQAEVWQARYGVAETFNFKLYNADGTLDVDEVDGGTEVSVSCNEGAETTATNDFVDEGTFYSIALTSGEMSCERVAVVVAATTTEVFFIQTIDNTSAMTPMIVQTGDSFARLGAPAGASVSADIVVLDNFVDDLESRLGTPSNLGGGATVAANLSDIEAQTDDIGTAGAGLTNIDLPNQTMDVTGTITTVTNVTNGVIIAESTSNCREVLGCDTQGTLSGTHSTTTADLGANAPTKDIAGMTLVIPSLNFSRAISSYNTSTGVATWETATAETLANSDQYYLFATAPGSSSSVSIAAGGITASSFAAGAIDAGAIAADAIGVSEIATDAIGAAELAASAIGASELATDALGAAELAADAVTEIQNGLATPTNITAGTITTVTNLTNLPAITANWLTAAGTAADFGTEVAAATAAAQGAITGTCDSGSTTTCVDNALTHTDATQLEDRLICFDDAWCALITTFTPGTDTATTTKTAPSTRASKAYTIFPATVE